MVQRELHRGHTATGGRDTLKDAQVRARDAEVHRQVIAVDAEMPDLPVPVREGVDEGLELRRHLGRVPWLVVDVDGRCVEFLHAREVVRVWSVYERMSTLRGSFSPTVVVDDPSV